MSHSLLSSTLCGCSSRGNMGSGTLGVSACYRPRCVAVHPVRLDCTISWPKCQEGIFDDSHLTTDWKGTRNRGGGAAVWLQGDCIIGLEESQEEIWIFLHEFLAWIYERLTFNKMVKWMNWGGGGRVRAVSSFHTSRHSPGGYGIRGQPTARNRRSHFISLTRVFFQTGLFSNNKLWWLPNILAWCFWKYTLICGNFSIITAKSFSLINVNSDVFLFIICSSNNMYLPHWLCLSNMVKSWRQ